MTGAPAIVVTGASSGIGREIARVAANDGQPLLLIGRAETKLCNLIRELEARGIQAHLLTVDLKDASAVDRVEALLSTQGLYCDVLVNSAGFGVFGAAAEADSADQLQLVDVNI